jgi:tubulin--tyrosine ligase-like protein 12
MARSMDTVVTSNLDVVIRLLETGPKIAQKYIHRPLTLRGKKIDLRFIVALRSLIPLEVYLYQVFWIRTSNINYTLDVKFCKYCLLQAPSQTTKLTSQ